METKEGSNLTGNNSKQIKEEGKPISEEKSIFNIKNIRKSNYIKAGNYYSNKKCEEIYLNEIKNFCFEYKGKIYRLRNAFFSENNNLKIENVIENNLEIEKTINFEINKKIINLEDNNSKTEDYKRDKNSELTSNKTLDLTNNFEFNLREDIEDDKKINGFFKFPKTLNFKKWTNDGYQNFGEEFLKILGIENENNEMDYVLTGVLIHEGKLLQNGHFYSLLLDPETKRWFKFNDSIVMEFNFEKNLVKKALVQMKKRTKLTPLGQPTYFFIQKGIYLKKKIFEGRKIGEKIKEEVFKENMEFINKKVFTKKNEMNYENLFDLTNSILSN